MQNGDLTLFFDLFFEDEEEPDEESRIELPIDLGRESGTRGVEHSS
ncbi:MAG TPA: hypothetical protein VIL97_10695 [Thermoanaerobaculia bacterium]